MSKLARRKLPEVELRAAGGSAPGLAQTVSKLMESKICGNIVFSLSMRRRPNNVKKIQARRRSLAAPKRARHAGRSRSLTGKEPSAEATCKRILWD
jgi:hypothetical protein